MTADADAIGPSAIEKLREACGGSPPSSGHDWVDEVCGLLRVTRGQRDAAWAELAEARKAAEVADAVAKRAAHDRDEALEDLRDEENANAHLGECLESLVTAAIGDQGETAGVLSFDAMTEAAYKAINRMSDELAELKKPKPADVVCPECNNSPILTHRPGCSYKPTIADEPKPAEQKHAGEAIRSACTAFNYFIAHRVGIDVGMIPKDEQSRREDLALWSRLCQAMTALELTVNPEKAAGLEDVP